MAGLRLCAVAETTIGRALRMPFVNRAGGHMEDQDARYTHTSRYTIMRHSHRTRNAGSWPWRAHWLNRFLCGRNRKQSSLEGPLNTLVTSLTGPVAYAIFRGRHRPARRYVAFASGEMGETMKRLLQIGIAVCLVVFAAQVMSSFIGQAAEVSMLQPVHAVTQSALHLVARG